MLRTQEALSVSTERAFAATKVDETLVRSTAKQVADCVAELERATTKVLLLPLEPGPEVDKTLIHSTKVLLIRTKVSLLHEVAKCHREFCGMALDTGLLTKPKEQDGKDGKLDLSKLTQLNITIDAAVRGIEKPAEAIELEAGEDVI